jgi:hypothetical protein
MLNRIWRTLTAEASEAPRQTITDWPFEDSPQVAVFTSRQVLEGAAILRVTHDEDDGAWQFHTGTMADDSDGRLVALKTIVARDASVTELADLPEGWVATREKPGDAWRRSRAV